MDKTYKVEHLYQPNGWLSPGYLTVSKDGIVKKISAETSDFDCEFLPGFGVPGTANLHSHAFQRALAGRTEFVSEDRKHDNLWTWREAMYQAADRLTPEIYQAIGEFVYLEMLKSGFTSVAEFHYVHHQSGGTPFDNPAEMSMRLMAAANDVGLGMTILPVLYCHGGIGKPHSGVQNRFVHSDTDKFIDLLSSLLPLESHTAQVGIALHSLRAVAANELDRVVGAAQAQRPGLRIHIHASETVQEVEECLAGLGARPVQWLLDNTNINQDWSVIHATHLDSSECTQLAASGAVAGICPLTEATMGDGYFPLPEFHAAQGAWGVGTDSHYCTSPAQELQSLEVGKRLQLARRNVIAKPGSQLTAHTGRALFDHALRGGFRAVGQNMGALEVGRRADLVMLDPMSPTLIGHDCETILDAWILSGSDEPVRDVMVAGKWQIRSGNHPRQELILRKYRNAIVQLFAK